MAIHKEYFSFIAAQTIFRPRFSVSLKVLSSEMVDSCHPTLEQTMVWRTVQYMMLWLQSVGRVAVVLLLGHRQGTRESKGFGGMFLDVSAMYFTTYFIRWNKLGFWM